MFCYVVPDRTVTQSNGPLVVTYEVQTNLKNTLIRYDTDMALEIRLNLKNMRGDISFKMS